jgi:hypothetical protein
VCSTALHGIQLVVTPAEETSIVSYRRGIQTPVSESERECV